MGVEISEAAKDAPIFQALLMVSIFKKKTRTDSYGNSSWFLFMPFTNSSSGNQLAGISDDR